MLKHIRKSQNDYIQGGIFLINLLTRNIRHDYNVRQVKNKGIPLIEDWNFERFKTSDTLFILGSGGSIADYTAKQFNIIKANDSLGFNFWVLHEFIPTYLTLEFSDHSVRDQSLWKNLQLRSSDYRNVPVIFKYGLMFNKHCELIPSKLDMPYLATSLNIPGSTELFFVKYLILLQKYSFFTPKRRSCSIIYKQASLSWLITFALYHEYKNIVLCGVDLNSREYFYDRDDSFIKENHLEVPDPGFVGEQHPTESGELSHFETPISRILKLTKKIVLDRQGVKLWVGSSTSALYPEIPLYDWT